MTTSKPRFRFFGTAMPAWYEWSYVAISLATFIHSSWAYSITMQGPTPPMDWSTFNASPQQLWAAGTYLMWYFWGGLMAFAIDVSMFFASREIRRGNHAHLVTFTVAAIFSALTQLLYAASHAGPLTYVASTLPAMAEGAGWLWYANEYRLVYLPISLPLTATIYTGAILWGDRLTRRAKITQEAELKVAEEKARVAAAKASRPVEPLEEETFTAREAAKVTGRNYQYILTLCSRGKLGHKDEETGTWRLTEEDINRLMKNKGIHQGDESEDVIVVDTAPQLPESVSGEVVEPPAMSHHGS